MIQAAIKFDDDGDMFLILEAAKLIDGGGDVETRLSPSR